MDFNNQAPMDALCEKWDPLLEHEALPKIDDNYKKKVTAQLLENQENALREQYLQETPNNQMGGNFADAQVGGAGALREVRVPVRVSLIAGQRLVLCLMAKTRREAKHGRHQAVHVPTVVVGPRHFVGSPHRGAARSTERVVVTEKEHRHAGGIETNRCTLGMAAEVRRRGHGGGRTSIVLKHDQIEPVNRT